MRQDVHIESDLPRLATPQPRRLGDFRKLRSVTIEGGEIRGERPEITDAAGYWNPFDAYYRDQKPYMKLADCGTIMVPMAYSSTRQLLPATAVAPLTRTCDR